ncbi:MAG: hypothetical protein AB1716_09550, partial [Planctomycetota bacterium]
MTPGPDFDATAWSRFRHEECRRLRRTPGLQSRDKLVGAEYLDRLGTPEPRRVERAEITDGTRITSGHRIATSRAALIAAGFLAVTKDGRVYLPGAEAAGFTVNPNGQVHSEPAEVHSEPEPRFTVNPAAQVHSEPEP